MRESPSFSICIPNYNYAQYIGITLKSVLEQTYQNFEIIVADNASTDDSVAVIEGLGSDKIRLLRNRYNVGFSPNLDRATQAAQNDFLILLSSDDVMMPHALESYADLIQRHPGSRDNLVLYSGVEFIDGEGRHVRWAEALVEGLRALVDSSALEPGTVAHLTGKEVFRTSVRDAIIPGYFASMAYSRALYQRVEGYASMHSLDPDVDFALKVMLQNPDVYYLNDFLFQYRVHNTNQNAQMAHAAHIKLFIDKYLYTLEHNTDIQEQSGISSDEVKDIFIDRWCLKAPFWQALRGQSDLAQKTFALGFATYPERMMKRPLTYVVGAMLAARPVTAWAGKHLSALNTESEGQLVAMAKKILPKRSSLL